MMPVSRYPMNLLGDLFYIIAPDGEIFEFATDTVRGVFSNFGSPPFNHITRQGYLQDGTTYLTSVASERTISVELVQQPLAGGRDEYWAQRQELLKFFRVNRGGLYQFIVQLPDETQYALDVMPDPGLTFAQVSSERGVIQETVLLKAFNPSWYSPASIDLELTGTVDTDLVFPITFPIQFGLAGIRFNTGALNYQGTWKSYPVITMTGPYLSVTIKLQPQNKILQLNVAIAVGDVRIINTNPENLTIEDAAGVSKFAELAIGADAVTSFFIDPEPPGAGQTIEIIMFHGTQGVSACDLSYNTRYIGI